MSRPAVSPSLVSAWGPAQGSGNVPAFSAAATGGPKRRHDPYNSPGLTPATNPEGPPLLELGDAGAAQHGHYQMGASLGRGNNAGPPGNSSAPGAPLGTEARRNFISINDPNDPRLRLVSRARDVPHLYNFTGTRDIKLNAGESPLVAVNAPPFCNVWCTYHREIVDWNWHHPPVATQFVRLLLQRAAEGFSAIRLDAFGYVWKELGTNCVNHEKLRLVLRLFRSCLDLAGAKHVALLPSVTNVSQQQNVNTTLSFGAQLAYHLPLPALLLHTLYSENTTCLMKWLAECPRAPRPGTALLNLCSTHDGIGLTWCAGILSAEDVQRLIDNVVKRGGAVRTRRQTLDAPPTVWELCCTAFAAASPCASSPDDRRRPRRALPRHSIRRSVAAGRAGLLSARSAMRRERP